LIGISHAVDVLNPRNDPNSLKKIVYPDDLEQKSIVKGTEVYQSFCDSIDILFKIAEGDYKIVDKNSNLDIVNLEIPKELFYLGLAPLKPNPNLTKIPSIIKLDSFNLRSPMNKLTLGYPNKIYSRSAHPSPTNERKMNFEDNSVKSPKFILKKREAANEQTNVYSGGSVGNKSVEPSKIKLINKDSMNELDMFLQKNKVEGNSREEPASPKKGPSISNLKSQIDLAEKTPMNKNVGMTTPSKRTMDRIIGDSSSKKTTLESTQDTITRPQDSSPTHKSLLRQATKTLLNLEEKDISKVQSTSKIDVKSITKVSSKIFIEDSNKNEKKGTSPSPFARVIPSIEDLSPANKSKREKLRNEAFDRPPSIENFYLNQGFQTKGANVDKSKKVGNELFSMQEGLSLAQHIRGPNTYNSSSSKNLMEAIKKKIFSHHIPLKAMPMSEPKPKKVALKINRFWLLPKKVNVIENDEEHLGQMFLVNSAKFILEPRIQKSLESTHDRDHKISDPKSSLSIFSLKITELIERLSKYYSCFGRLQQLAKAWALAKWILRSGCPLDKNVIESFNHRQLIKHYDSRISSLQTFNLETPHKTPSSDLSQIYKEVRSTSTKTRYPVIQVRSNCSSLDNSLVEALNNKKYDYHPYEMEFNLMAICIDFDETIFENELRNINKDEDISKMDLGLARKFYFEKQFTEKLKGRKSSMTSLIDDCAKVDFPLFPHKHCITCKRSLRYSEVLFPFKGAYFCRLHHPYSCNYCFKIAQNKYIKIGNRIYHKECLVCSSCGKLIGNEKVFSNKDYVVHVRCNENYRMEEFLAQVGDEDY